MNPIIFIPARMASTRLPGKPLEDIAGKPMVVHVLERAMEADCGPVYVACAEQEIAEAVEKAGGNALLTRPDHSSGSDRICEALEKADPEGKYDTVINVQGDLPTLDPAIIAASLLPYRRMEQVDITTLVTEITDKEEESNPNVVKAVVAWNHDGQLGRALYFTRARAPAGEGPCYHHIGLYSYKRAALKKFTSLPPSPLERREKLEQLRALEHTMHIAVVKVDAVPLGVDTEEDITKARKLIAKEKI